MAKPVQPVPSLLFPRTGTADEQRDQVRQNQTILIDHARRLNLSLPMDGTERMGGPLPLAEYATVDLPDATLYEGALVYDTTVGLVKKSNGVVWAAVGSGDVVGPSSAVNSNVAFFDTTTGKLIKDLGVNVQSIAKDYGLTASVGSNILTIALKDPAGNDATATTPIAFQFRNVTAATGTPTYLTVTGALSLTTNATGATQGTVNNVPFRTWIVLFNDGGTARLALIQRVVGGASPTKVHPLPDHGIASATGISGSATAAGTFYTTNGVTITSKAYKIIGYFEYSSGLATAGSYASTPTLLQVFTQTTPKPSDVIQSNLIASATQTITGSTTYVTTALTLTISPTAACNLIRARAASVFVSGTADFGFGRIHRGSTAIGSEDVGGSTGSHVYNINCMALDAPGTTSSTTYALFVHTNAGNSMTFNNNNGIIEVEEIMV